MENFKFDIYCHSFEERIVLNSEFGLDYNVIRPERVGGDAIVLLMMFEKEEWNCAAFAERD